MKKLFLLTLVLIIAALSVMSVSAAPRGRYYDQMGNKYWCNSDGYGCWVTGENGGKDYIMFWSEAAAEAIMGPNSGAPIGTNPGTQELPLQAPKPVTVAAPGSKGVTCASWEELQKDGTCKQVACSDANIQGCEEICRCNSGNNRTVNAKWELNSRGEMACMCHCAPASCSEVPAK